jgi:hypothetical protein
MALQPPPPSVWGPSVWRAIHFIALGFPDENDVTPMQREAYKMFFQNLDAVLPCASCAENYREHLKHDVPPVPVQSPPDGSATRDALFAWTVMLHNTVSKSLGKTREWTVRDAYAALVGEAEAAHGKRNHATSSGSGGSGTGDRNHNDQMWWCVVSVVSIAVVVVAILLLRA